MRICHFGDSLSGPVSIVYAEVRDQGSDSPIPEPRSPISELCLRSGCVECFCLSDQYQMRYFNPPDEPAKQTAGKRQINMGNPGTNDAKLPKTAMRSFFVDFKGF